MAATPPTKQSLLHLYHSMLRTSQSFSSYNFRNYFVRRTKTMFREIQDETDPTKLTAFYNEKAKELAVLKRSAIVNQLYGGWRLVVEDQKPVRDRGDT
ncbi:hypothetical protein GSI_09060 [Ganoderma sinense ZZ0214-1]|uniref:Complex 1 LYR protein domain-containing protein n=1 Tax=Ganoderma sinense ZZ0214-1 TaxID=1077348 RepID=A0A2G8S5G2_9APHY|nr:hypothetical protein GSI_09060 [Ganoderma sinense ZZ0214-1]